MKIKLLIILNVATSFLLMLSVLALVRFEPVLPSLILPAVATLWAFFALFFANFAGVIVYWKRHRILSFLPLATYGILAVVCYWGTSIVSQAVLEGTPVSPHTFLHDTTRRDLEDIAGQLLGQSFKTIYSCRFEPSGVGVLMIAGHAPNEIPPGLFARIRRHGFDKVDIDDAQSMVIYSHYRLRSWYHYIYSNSESLPLYKRPVSFSQVDIHNWDELLRIAKQGSHTAAAESQRVVFSPELVYDYLYKKLGDDVMKAIRDYESSTQITLEQKELVLAALNEQRQISSRLVEHPKIRYDDTEPQKPYLRIGTLKLSNSFWETSLTKELLKQGTLVYGGDGQHLRINSNISDEEAIAIEWLHVGLMNNLYRNLISKRAHRYSIDLGGGWYFNRR